MDATTLADRGYELLAQGRFLEGWPLYEHRLPRVHSPMLKAGLQEWLGEPLGGKSILVYGDQGHGDEIMFARFVRQLRAQHPQAKITLAVLPANVRLFDNLGADEVLGRLGK